MIRARSIWILMKNFRISMRIMSNALERTTKKAKTPPRRKTQILS